MKTDIYVNLAGEAIPRAVLVQILELVDIEHNDDIREILSDYEIYFE